MVFYRKYRPQTIEELDSFDIRDTLYAVLSAKDISHAFLFTGPKGLGKTSTARIVAKVVNCESRNHESGIMNQGKDKKEGKPQKKTHNSSFMIHNLNNIEPCNKCYQCISITNGTNVDVLEIDGASNRGIDEIRDLREKVRLSAARASKKVYIIDEVHMLTQEAFNALLKTLEEPPPHVIFILCTTEPHKLPQTIVSRCVHVSFKKAAVEELVRSFKRIAKKENLDIDGETLSMIATLSDGSFRDGVKILEEMALISEGKKITKELIEQKYQISNIKYQISQMVGFLSKKNTKEALSLISRLTEQGVDMKFFLEQIISELHEMLLREVGVGFARGPVAPSSDPMSSVASSLRALDGTSTPVKQANSTFGLRSSTRATSRLDIQEIKELVELLTKAHAELKYAVLPQLPLEMAIVGWGIQKTQNQAELDQNTQIVRESDSQRFSDSPSFPSVQKTSNGPRASQTDNFWQELINKVKSHNHSIAAVLRGCGLKEYDGKNLVIETKYKFHKDKLEDIKNRALIEKACGEIAKNKVRVSVLLKSA